MVNLLHCSKENFANLVTHKKIVCYGAGKRFSKFVEFWLSKDSIHNILCVIDSKKANQEINYFGKSIPIYSLDQLCNNLQCDDFILVITNIYDSMEIVGNLDLNSLLNGKYCFIEHIIDGEYPEQSFDHITDSEPKIDKVIHYCWFGKAEIPEHLQKCIDSWKKYCPDYKIIRWDESNYDITKNKYMRDAYDTKMWGFASDYARLDIIYSCGGFYLDTDVELIKTLDILRGNSMYCGFESSHFVNFGLGYGATKGHRIIKKILEVYEELLFEMHHGLPAACPIYQSKVLLDEGVRMNNTFQKFEDLTVYPSEVLAPVGPYGIGSGITENTVSIHHYDASWVADRLENREKLEKNINSYLHRVKR